MTFFHETSSLPEDTSAVLRWIEALYGRNAIDDPTWISAGLYQVIALWAQTADRHVVIRIAPDSPRSLRDIFCLNLARARADTIIITGKILRDEPHLRYEIAPGLRRWRRELLGLQKLPELVVLTRTMPDPNHPALRGPSPSLIYTTSEIAKKARSAGLEVHPDEQPSLAKLVRWLRARGQKNLCLEAGARTTADLYSLPANRNDPTIDELMLSRYAGSILPNHLRGLSFPSLHGLGRYFDLPADDPSMQPPTELWTFSRMRRMSQL